MIFEAPHRGEKPNRARVSVKFRQRGRTSEAPPLYGVIRRGESLTKIAERPRSYFVTKPPIRNRPMDPLSAAEAAFKRATTQPAAPVQTKAPLPASRELVSLRVDQDVLEHFQEEGPGWQDRINAALRKAAGL
jgi:uncharacterized protein (DUF4415 family)